MIDEFVVTSVIEPGENNFLTTKYYRNVEIIRCKDCIYYEPLTYKHFTCTYHQSDMRMYDFCSQAERRGDAE